MAKVPTKPIAGKLTIEDTEVAVTLKPKQFGTGSVGYFMSEKLELGGKRYQMSGSVVEIGSKPKPPN